MLYLDGSCFNAKVANITQAASFRQHRTQYKPIDSLLIAPWILARPTVKTWKIKRHPTRGSRTSQVNAEITSNLAS